MKAALNKMKTTPGYTSEDAIIERIAFIKYQIWTESTTLKVEKKPLAEIADLKQLEDMNSDIAAKEVEELEHIDPEQVAEKEQAASQAETDGAVSKKKAALREAAAAQKIAVKALEHHAEVKAESHVKKKTLEAQEAWRRPRSRSPSVRRRHFLRISTIRAQMPRRRKTSVTMSGRPRFRQLLRPLRFSRRIRQMP